mgnify:CR=1 FL=1
MTTKYPTLPNPYLMMMIAGSAYSSEEKKMKPFRLPFTISLRWTSTNSNP